MAGNVTFFPVLQDERLSVDTTDASTVLISNSNGGGTSLSLVGNAATNRMGLTTPHLDVENGATVNASDTSLLIVGREGMNFFSPNANCILNGTLLVSGSGTLIDSSTTTFPSAGTARDVYQYVGTNGGTGSLDFQNGSMDNFIGGPLLIADDVTSGTGNVSLSGGATLTVAGHVTLATHSADRQTGTLYIDGSGTALRSKMCNPLPGESMRGPPAAVRRGSMWPPWLPAER